METGGTVTIPVGGFIASESFIKQSGGRTKYSFTMVDAGVSRVSDVTASLLKSDGNGGWSTVGAPLSYPGLLPITIATANFDYLGNAGAFGNANVYGSLHTVTPMSVNDILLSDNFPNNDSDLNGGNVHQAFYGGTPGVDQYVLSAQDAGVYRISVTGTAKSNTGTGTQGFGAVSNLTQFGGCTPQ